MDGCHRSNIAGGGVNKCQTCLAGTVDLDSDSATPCETCVAGTYGNGAGQTVCVDCAAGKYNDAAGGGAEADCKSCAAGKWSAALGAADISTWYVVGVGVWVGRARGKVTT